MPANSLNLDRNDFLANYWQKRPLLIRSALRDFKPPVDANTLAGLAMEEEIESRIIEYRANEWRLSHGPFAEQDFDRNHPWTLLVQAVDHYLPEVAELRKLVDFIPQWRIDDVMISYAEDGGSVGPHYDNYDVFLLQGEGQRTWQLGQHCDENTALEANQDLRILAHFQCVEEHTLSCGDILYVPPGVAHWGIAQGECMTYSIGFRAPRLSELLSRNVDSVLEDCQADRFYRDAESLTPARAGEISSEAIRSAKAQLLSLLDQSSDDSWFGELVTEQKYELDLCTDSDTDSWENACVHIQAGNSALELLPACKLAWQHNGDQVQVFVNGERLDFSAAVIPDLMILCENWQLKGADLKNALNSRECSRLLKRLFELGCLVFP